MADDDKHDADDDKHDCDGPCAGSRDLKVADFNFGDSDEGDDYQIGVEVHDGTIVVDVFMAGSGGSTGTRFMLAPDEAGALADAINHATEHAVEMLDADLANGTAPVGSPAPNGSAN